MHRSGLNYSIPSTLHLLQLRLETMTVDKLVLNTVNEVCIVSRLHGGSALQWYGSPTTWFEFEH